MAHGQVAHEVPADTMTDTATLGYILLFVGICSGLGGSLALILRTAARTERNNMGLPRTSSSIRAQQKLKSCLDEYQLADYRRNGAFNVVGKRYIYRITHDREWVHAYHLDGLLPSYTFGYGPLGESWRFPSEDIMLSKKLAIEADEGRLLRQACICPWSRREKLNKRYLPPEAFPYFQQPPISAQRER